MPFPPFCPVVQGRALASGGLTLLWGRSVQGPGGQKYPASKTRKKECVGSPLWVPWVGHNLCGGAAALPSHSFWWVRLVLVGEPGVLVGEQGVLLG